MTISTNKESAAFIVCKKVKGRKFYYYTTITIGEHDNVIKYYSTNRFLTSGAVAFAHTHPYCNGHYGENDAMFSWGDCITSIGMYCYCSDVGSGNLYRIKNEVKSIFNGGKNAVIHIEWDMAFLKVRFGSTVEQNKEVYL